MKVNIAVAIVELRSASLSLPSLFLSLSLYYLFVSLSVIWQIDSLYIFYSSFSAAFYKSFSLVSTALLKLTVSCLYLLCFKTL